MDVKLQSFPDALDGFAYLGNTDTIITGRMEGM